MAVMLMVTGCGTINGQPCEARGAHQCDGSDVAYCEGSAWKTYACPAGCGLDGLCAWGSPALGTPCPYGAEAASICTADGELTTCALGAESSSALWVAFPCARCVKGAEPKSVLRDDGSGHLRCD